MSGNRSGLGFVVTMVVWIACVIVYARSWSPSQVTLCTIHPDQRIFILKLPVEGPLQQLLRKGSVVTLAAPAPAPSAMSAPRTTPPPNATIATTNAPKAAEASDLLPPPSRRVENAIVLDTICGIEQTPTGKMLVCYACIAVKNEDAEFLMASAKIWVLLQH